MSNVLVITETPLKVTQHEDGNLEFGGTYLAVTKTTRLIGALGHRVSIFVVAPTGKVLPEHEITPSIVGPFDDSASVAQVSREEVLQLLKMKEFDALLLLLRNSLVLPLFSGEPSLSTVLSEKGKGREIPVFVVAGKKALEKIEDVKKNWEEGAHLLERPGVSRITVNARKEILEVLSQSP